MSAVLKRITAIAKGLNKAELHVLIELAARAEVAGHHDAAANWPSRPASRERAYRLRLTLYRRGVIKSDFGGATGAAQRRLSFLTPVEIEGSPTIGPGAARRLVHGGLKNLARAGPKL